MPARFVPSNVAEMVDWLAGAVSAQTGMTINTGAGGASGDFVVQTNGVEAARFLFGSAGPPSTQGTLLFGHGDAISLSGQSVTTGRWIDVRQGTNASADTGLVPPIKISRTITNTFASITGDGAEQLAGLSSSVRSVAGSEVQPVGVFAIATQSGTTVDSADAVGVYAVADIVSASAGTGTAIPLFLDGVKNYSGQRISSAQITAENRSGVASTWSASTARDCLIEVFNFTGSSKIAAGIQFNASTGHLDVGLGFHAGGYIEVASIIDESSSPYSIIINGSHTRGIDMTGGTFSGSAMAIPNNVGIVGENNAGSAARNLIKIDTSDQTILGDPSGSLIVAENNLYTGVKNIITDTTTGTKIGTSTSQKIAFFNATPVVQPTGSTDVLASLVTLGLRAASSNPPLDLGAGALTAGTSSFADATFSSTVTFQGSVPFQIPNAVSVKGRNAANNAYLAMFAFNSSDQFAVQADARFGGDTYWAEGKNISLGTTTGTKIGVSTSQKIGFFNATPVVQPTSTTDLRTALINLGLYATGGASPLNLNGGTLTAANGVFGTNAATSGTIGIPNGATSAFYGRNAANDADLQLFYVNTSNRLTFATVVEMGEGVNLVTGTTTGTKIGSSTSQKVSFWNKTPIVQPTTGISGASNTNPGTGTAITTTSTFGGYTLAQLAAVLINTGLAA